MRPFPLAHLDHLGQSLLERLFHRRPEILVHCQLLIGLEHPRRPGQLVQRHRARQLELLGQARELPRIGLGQRHVQMHPRRGLAGARVQGHPRRQPAPRNAPVDHVADLRFEQLHLARQVHGDFGLLAVDRAELDGDLEAVLGAIPAPITRH